MFGTPRSTQPEVLAASWINPQIYLVVVLAATETSGLKLPGSLGRKVDVEQNRCVGGLFDQRPDEICRQAGGAIDIGGFVRREGDGRPIAQRPALTSFQ